MEILNPTLAFSLGLLVGAGTAERPLTVCSLGHLVVAGNSHYAPEALTADLKALTCRLVERCGTRTNP